MNQVVTFCISKGRFDNARRIQDMCQVDHWIVPPEEKAFYLANGAKGVIGVEGGLIDARNYALEFGQRENVTICELSDDLEASYFWVGKKEKKACPFGILAGWLAEDAQKNPDTYLFGVPPTANQFFASGTVKTRNFIIGDFFLCKPTHLRFDTKLRLKEDYDFTLQHIREYGKVFRDERILLGFRHYKNKGGAVAYRSAELERQTCLYLLNKWPGWLRPNPMRANEVIISIPKDYKHDRKI